MIGTNECRVVYSHSAKNKICFTQLKAAQFSTQEFIYAYQVNSVHLYFPTTSQVNSVHLYFPAASQVDSVHLCFPADPQVNSVHLYFPAASQVNSVHLCFPAEPQVNSVHLCFPAAPQVNSVHLYFPAASQMNSVHLPLFTIHYFRLLNNVDNFIANADTIFVDMDTILRYNINIENTLPVITSK